MSGIFRSGSKVAPVFGGTIEDPRGQQFLVDCLDVLETCVSEEGLYRMSGSKEDMTNAHRDINKGKSVDLTAMAAKSAHTVAGLLKLYFRELKPEPLMTFNLYECLIAASQEDDQEERRRILFGLLSMLPRTNFKVLTVLMSHLQFVVQHKAANKMDCNNLAIVFGPILLGSRNDSVGVIITDVSHVIRLMSVLIQDCDFFFPDKHVEIAEKPSDSPPPATKEKSKKEKKSKDKVKEKEKEKEEEPKDWASNMEKKRRATNVKKINEEWTKRAEETTSTSPSGAAAALAAAKKSKKERKQEQLERKERKAKQKRINERWQRMGMPASPSLGRSATAVGGMKKEKERLEGLYSQRSSRAVQRITVNEFLQERASRIKSGAYTYEELQAWTQALNHYSEAQVICT